MADTPDYVTEFFDSAEAARKAEQAEISNDLNKEDFDIAEPKIRKILSDKGLDKTTIEFAINPIRDAYLAYKDDDLSISEYDAQVNAEISDALTFFFPDKDASEVALIACEISDAINDNLDTYADLSDGSALEKAIEDDVDPKPSLVRDDTFDELDDDDVDLTFWD